ncbi:hypothetical protein NC651_001361 [Populus alba x Populus x berolinensis]|nr:hypothetical protein NC651_001361 [Populus alba x Populus x berolinensis]
MIIISSPLAFLICENLRVFGPGLNPFSPYCVDHYSTSR